jgi:hypothetical protein
MIDHNILNNIKDTQLGKYLKYYELYYIEKYNNLRIINWFPHFGEINITFMDKQIILLPIQFMILELFNDKNGPFVANESMMGMTMAMGEAMNQIVNQRNTQLQRVAEGSSILGSMNWN